MGTSLYHTLQGFAGFARLPDGQVILRPPAPMTTWWPLLLRIYLSVHTSFGNRSAGLKILPGGPDSTPR